jgi:hypothetical protein
MEIKALEDVEIQQMIKRLAKELGAHNAVELLALCVVQAAGSTPAASKAGFNFLARWRQSWLTEYSLTFAIACGERAFGWPNATACGAWMAAPAC